jgi:Na+/melibiose symporter-like transporter
MLFSLIGLIPMSNYFIFGIFFVAGIGLSLGAWNIFPYLIYADLAEDNQIRGTGTLKAGIYAGFPSIALNIFQAVSLFIAGAILKLPNYAFAVGDKSIGYVLWGPITSVILIITLIYSIKYIELDFPWEKPQLTK